MRSASFRAAPTLVLLSCWTAALFGQDPTLFKYGSREGAGCFAQIAEKDWVQFTPAGTVLAFQEVSRGPDGVELLEPKSDGVRVRLSPNDARWTGAKESHGDWKPIGEGAWTTSFDLTKRFEHWKLLPRPQGPRGTCSVFTTVSAIEYALANRTGKPSALSVEFANWASNQAGGDKHDGSFFHTCLDGFWKYGICRDELMPYQAKFDPETRPSSAALEDAGRLSSDHSNRFHVHWILPPGNQDPGLTPRQVAEVKATLLRGFPVAFGSGHSVLLVGFRDDVTKPGGGEFLIKDSAAAAFGTYSYEFVRTKPFDVFWIECDQSPPKKRSSWAYRTGTFKQTEPGKWTETGGGVSGTPVSGGKFSFDEVARTPDYVELRDASRDLTVRIYGDTFSKLFYKTPKMRVWGLMYDGGWVE